MVTISGKDYLYVTAAYAYVMYGYRLDGPGQAVLIDSLVLQQGNTTNLPNLAGNAAFLQPQYAH